MKKQALTNKNGDARSLTAADFKRMRPARVAEPELAAQSSRRKRAKKGEPTKLSVHMRLSPQVVAFFKAGGPGWQTRIDRTLAAIVDATTKN